MASLQFNPVVRNNLYYNKYSYKATCRLPGVRFTYYVKNIDEYKYRIEKAKKQDWHKNTDFDIISFDAIEKFLDFRTKHKKDITIRTESDIVGVYSNDKSVFDYIDFADYGIDYSFVSLGEPGTITFKRKPKHNYRTYFKSTRVPTSVADGLQTFDERISSGLYKASFSKTLKKNLDNGMIRPNKWIHGSYYIDYDQESLTTILHMMFSGSLGTTYKLVQKE